MRDTLERKSEQNPTLFMTRVLAAEQALIDGDEQRFNVCLIAGGRSSPMMMMILRLMRYVVTLEVRRIVRNDCRSIHQS